MTELIAWLGAGIIIVLILHAITITIAVHHYLRERRRLRDAAWKHLESSDPKLVFGNHPKDREEHP
jgi:hypothetical protein